MPFRASVGSTEVLDRGCGGPTPIVDPARDAVRVSSAMLSPPDSGLLDRLRLGHEADQDSGNVAGVHDLQRRGRPRLRPGLFRDFILAMLTRISWFVSRKA
jgi:hypothetical protein